MQQIPLPASSDDFHDHAQRLAWRVLLAAAQWARGPGELARSATAFGVDAFGKFVQVDSLSREAWLTWLPGSGWEMVAAPASARTLLELYLPMCAASKNRPFTIGHLGQSLDGYIATGSGDSYYVTGPENVRHLHRLRALCDAVVVGVETVARDDPQLTVRRAEGSNPARVILDPNRRLRADRRVFRDAAARTLIVCAAGAADSSSAAADAAEVLTVPLRAGRLSLDILLAQLHVRGMHSVFVEGGGATVSGFLEAGLLDRLHVAIAPLLTGSGKPGISLPARDKIGDCLRPAYRMFAMGGDILFDCDLHASAVPLAADGPHRDLARVF